MDKAHETHPIEFLRHGVVALFVFFALLALLAALFGVSDSFHLLEKETVAFGEEFLLGDVLMLSLGLLLCSTLVLPLVGIPKEVNGFFGLVRFAIAHCLFLLAFGALSLFAYAKMY